MHTKHIKSETLFEAINSVDKDILLLSRQLQSLEIRVLQCEEQIKRLAKCVKDCDDELLKTAGGTDEGD
jgi:hypothetical protein